MSLKLQKTSIDVEKFSAINHANDECPERPFDSKPSSLTSDQEYVRLMEERYGIREEGVF
jgi:hypothetical protein